MDLLPIFSKLPDELILEIAGHSMSELHSQPDPSQTCFSLLYHELVQRLKDRTRILALQTVCKAWRTVGFAQTKTMTIVVGKFKYGRCGKHKSLQLASEVLLPNVKDQPLDWMVMIDARAAREDDLEELVNVLQQYASKIGALRIRLAASGRGDYGTSPFVVAMCRAELC